MSNRTCHVDLGRLASVTVKACTTAGRACCSLENCHIGGGAPHPWSRRETFTRSVQKEDVDKEAE